MTRISREIRSWALHHRSDKSPTELVQMYNPCIRGWITYYSHFYKTQLRPTLKRIDAYVIRWARRKFKRLRHQTKGARGWFDRLRRANPTLFAHWPLCHGNGEHREPCDSRGSCTVLGAPGGEIPPGDSTKSSGQPNDPAASGFQQTADMAAALALFGSARHFRTHAPQTRTYSIGRPGGYRTVPVSNRSLLD
ncbi:group II intron maturase-specific domain-containing protein [Bradyrhizobium sp. Rc2d]|uniref:group II intron maturase-specific domain-containing protein n=1 Tax=Bradyrhizobium sp. Rc2d TaxID=1855321 RepID=UPI0032E02421